MSEQLPTSPAFARKLVIAAVVEGAWLLLVIGAYLLTENIWLLIGGAMLGALPLSLWIMRQGASASKPKPPSIVEGGPR